MAALETLSNKELRQKCIEYGMPNIPVTDSSRKVLIRRLEAAISGKPVATTPAKTNRRETMHVSKPSEMVASSTKIKAAVNNNNTTVTDSKPAAPNRASRRTIAATERHVATTTTVSEPEYSDVSPDRGEVHVMLPPKAKTPEKPGLYPKLPQKEPSPKPQMLSKTGVVTTSFMQEARSSDINKTYAEPFDIDSAEEEILEPVKKTFTKPISAYNSGYVPLSESKVTTTAALPSTLSSSTRYSSLGTYGSYTKPSTTLTSSTLRQSYAGPSYTSTYNQPRMAQQYATDEYDGEYADEDEDEDDDEDIVLVEDSPVGKDVQTPFLSQFARNLETLKATPLRHSMGPTRISPPKSAGSLRNREPAYNRRTIGGVTSAGIAPRRTLANAAGEEESAFRQFIMTLEEKYHLKQTFIIISIFILAIFIYVFFIQSV